MLVAIGINGVSVKGSIGWKFEYTDSVDCVVQMISTEDFLKNEGINFINSEDVEKSDAVVMVSYHGRGNNTYEVHQVKKMISMLYFAKRNYESNQRVQEYYKDCHKKYNEMEIKANDRLHDYFANYDLEGYRGHDVIHTFSWNVKLGNSPYNRDEYERYLSRAFYNEDVDEYNRKYNPVFHPVSLEPELYTHELEKILFKLKKADVYSKKLDAAFRLYFETLCTFDDPDNTIVMLSTILETLLLGRDEDCQRKKVSARAACIVANNFDIEHKKFVANQVYCFYKYRNAIVHDGKGILDFEFELAYNKIICGIKHIIYCIIKAILDEDISSVEDIMDIVTKNCTQDGLMQGFDYIELKRFDNNPNACCDLIFEED